MSFRHGTYKGYATEGCRCTRCVEYQMRRNAQNRLDRLETGRLNHGKRSAYDAGCRCTACTAARRAAYVTNERRAG